MDDLLCNILQISGSLSSPKILKKCLFKGGCTCLSTLLKTFPKLPKQVGSHFKSQSKWELIFVLIFVLHKGKCLPWLSCGVNQDGVIAGSWRVSASGQTSGQCNHSINSQLYLNNSKNCNRNVFPRSPHRFMSSSSFPLGSQGKNGGTFGFCHNPIPKFNYMTQLELISA